MKKSFFVISAAALVMTACSSDDLLQENGAGYADGEVVFSVELPGGINSRSVSDGLSATELTYAVFDNSGKFLFEKNVGNQFSGKKANVNIPLVNGLTYNIAFFAKSASAPYTIQNGVLSMNYDGTQLANDDIYDAFYKVENVSVANDMPARTVKLTRPFAQVNIGASDWKDAVKAGYVVDKTRLTHTAEVYTTMNLLDGTVDNMQAVDFVLNDLPDVDKSGKVIAPATLTVATEDFDYMAMTYVLVPEEASVINTVTFTYSGPNGDVDYAVNSVPVQRNHRTNIVGKFFTTSVEYNIIIDEQFDTPDNNINLWDGKSTSAPVISGTTATVSTPSQLAGLAEMVAAGDNLAGKTVVLEEDIDLGGFEWTPIGTAETPFKGDFDGQGHTISNLVINNSHDNYVGFFGNTNTGTIKNINIDGVIINSDFAAGAVSGNPFTTNFENITVTGLVQIDAKYYSGGVLGRNAYGDITNVTIDAAPGSYVKAISDDGGTAYRTYVGGVVGFVGESSSGKATIKNVKSNIDVIGSTCDVGGIVGIAHYGTNFVNCSSSGNISILRATDDSDWREIGGIAGVWHNENGTSVTFTDCSFTGTLSAKMEDGTDMSDQLGGNTIVGKAYSGKAIKTGTLTIDGDVVYSTDYRTVNNSGDYMDAISNLYTDQSAFYGRTIALGQDIDLKGRTIGKMAGNGPHNLTIQGNNHAIKNFTAKQAGSAGLFSTANACKFCNLTIEGATVEAPEADDAYAGALIGKSYSVVLDNITVKNSSIKGVNKVGGLVGFSSEDATYTFNANDCHVENCVITNFSRPGEAGQLGGFIGYIQATATITGCSVTNCNITANMDRADRYCDEFAGTFHGGSGLVVEFQDITCSGNAFTLQGTAPVAAKYGTTLGGMRVEGGTVKIDGTVQ